MILYYLLASLGLCYILKYGTILNPIRNFLTAISSFLKELFSCSLCLGFWSGAIISPLVFKDYSFSIAIIFPLASAAFCWTIDLIMDLIVEMINKTKKY